MKILGNLILLFLSITNFAYAGVSATLSSTQIQRGDSVKLIISIDGNSAEAPNIASIGPYRIEGRSQSTQIQNINGKYSKLVRYEYTFTPLKTIIIEPIEVMVDGKVEKTERIQLTVSNTPQQGVSQEYDLKLIAQKKSVYVGEPFAVDMVFKRNRFKQIHDTRYTPPGTTDFWVKKNSNVEKSVAGDDEIQSIRYIYAAQKSGKLTISPARINVATARVNGFQSFFSNPLQWKNLISNEVQIDVKPLPKETNIVGEVSVTTKVDKTSLDAKEPVTLLVLIKGAANVEDINLDKLDIDGVVQYEEEPNIKHEFQNGNYFGIYEKKVALIAENDFVIPSIEIKYFDPKDKKVKIAKSKEIRINVKASAKNEKSDTLNIQSAQAAPILKEVTVYKTRPIELFLAFLVGLFVALLYTTKPWQSLKKESNAPKKQTGHKDALMKLMPYVETDVEIAKMVDALEAKMYKNSDIEIDKKKLKELLKKTS